MLHNIFLGNTGFNISQLRPFYVLNSFIFFFCQFNLSVSALNN